MDLYLEPPVCPCVRASTCKAARPRHYRVTASITDLTATATKYPTLWSNAASVVPSYYMISGITASIPLHYIHHQSLNIVDRVTRCQHRRDVCGSHRRQGGEGSANTAEVNARTSKTAKKKPALGHAQASKASTQTHKHQNHQSLTSTLISDQHNHLNQPQHHPSLPVAPCLA